jgi:hypothetical protein
MIRKSDMPAAFIAVSSKFSPKLPKVMSEANKIANGNAMGMSVKVAYRKNSNSTEILTPFPTNSVICFHKNCINKMRMQIRKVIKKREKNRRKTYQSIILSLNMPIYF